MDSKEIRIARLQKEIEEIRKEKPLNYALIKVVPDCGAGIRDREDVLVIAIEIDDLIAYAEERFEYEVSFGRKRNDNGQPCETWYYIDHTPIEIM